MLLYVIVVQWLNGFELLGLICHGRDRLNLFIDAHNLESH